MLIEIGRHGGLEEIEGQVLTDNRRMLKICRELGFSTKWAPGGITEIRLRLK
jgi:acetyltransferase